MPKGTHAEPLTWNEALAVAGTETRLAQGYKKKTVAWWKSSDSVPAYVVIRLVKDRLKARPSQLIGAVGILTAPEGAMSDRSFVQAWREVADVWKARKTHPDLWAGLCRILADIHGLIPDPSTAEPRQTRATGDHQ